MDQEFDIVESVINLAGNVKLSTNTYWKTTEHLSMSSYLYNNKEALIRALIENQQACPESSDRRNEDNIKIGISYEYAVSGALDLMEHAYQDVGSDTKRDLVYRGLENEQLEFKSGTYDLSNKRARIDWLKKNGDRTLEDWKADFLAKAPDGLLLYQKFDVFLGRAAAVAYVPKEKLIEVSDRITQSATNLFVHIDLDDCEWHHIETKIPQKQLGYAEAKSNLERAIEMISQEAVKQLSACYSTSEYDICDSHRIDFIDCNRIKKPVKLQLQAEAKSLRVLGYSIHDIAHRTRVRHKRLSDWFGEGIV